MTDKKITININFTVDIVDIPVKINQHILDD